LQGYPFVHERLGFLLEEQPVVFQIFDSEPTRLLEVALRLQALGPAIIDINMGCSARHVSGRGAGAGLLRTPLKIARIFRTLSRALEVPVTGKIRLGWDESTRNHRLVARIIEENGGQLIAVHGRTRQQAYSGQADWDAIAEVRQSVKIPVIANGDVRHAADINRVKQHTGCPGVMIGRAAIGNPWIFQHMDRQQVAPDEVRRVVKRHLDLSLAYYGEQRGLMLFRKHASRYLNPAGELRQRMLTTFSTHEFLDCVEMALEGAPL
jgi:nifR3 family TIM-barrel protein